jgi:regulator of protease activity HflC (stomatin/prohibitin superfamily)
MAAFTPILTLGFIFLFFFFNWIKVLKEYERGVIFRLGRALDEPKGPGLILVLWPIDVLKKVSLRTIVMDVPPQDIITKDNVSVKVNAVVYYRVLDPKKAILQVQDYQYATSQLSQTTLRSVLGEVELDELLSARDKLNLKLQTIIDQHSDPWGVKVSMVEIKHVDLPQDMQRAMAKQAEAERERRAKVIHAEGENEASAKLLMAANTMSQNPTTLQPLFSLFPSTYCKLLPKNLK